ncbi:MAG: SH3 domain-containing protein [Anaerolineae bacterium]
MSKRTFAMMLLTGVLFGLLFQHKVMHAGVTLQTIPTRTPTPPPQTPTEPPTTPTPPTATATSPPPTAPTNTPQPPATMTPLPPTATQLATAVSSYPTAEPCSTHPTAQTFGATNVRGGPGLDYEVVATLPPGEVKPITGRAANSEWWLIQLETDQQGWVADLVVLVQGNSQLVPIAVAPPINGYTPTPGAPWNPTPPPSCTITPTATTATVQTQEETPTPTPTSQPVVAPTAEDQTTAVPPTPAAAQENAPPTPVIAAGQPATAPPTPPALAAAAATPVSSNSIPPTPEPLDVDTGSGTTPWLLIGGVTLLGVGIWLTLHQRQERPPTGDV